MQKMFDFWGTSPNRVQCHEKITNKVKVQKMTGFFNFA